MEMLNNAISGSGYEDIIFLKYKDELENEAKKLREENNLNSVILLCHIYLDCGKDNLTLNMCKPSDFTDEECNKESALYKLINSLDEGIIDAIVTGHSHREVHHFIKNIPVICPINNGLPIFYI